MPALDSRFYLTADGGGRVETATHPDTGKRVWSCSACTARGEGEGNGREHAASHNSASRTGLFAPDHFS